MMNFYIWVKDLSLIDMKFDKLHSQCWLFTQLFVYILRQELIKKFTICCHSWLLKERSFANTDIAY